MARPFGTFKYRSLEELESAIDDYFESCDGKPIMTKEGLAATDKNGNPVYTPSKPYTLEGLALHLNITPQTLVNYGKNEDYFEAIERARMKCLTYVAERMYDKDGVQGAKFYAINNSERMGGLKYADKVEHDINVAPITFIDDLGE
jgi:hypothetical protein